jgi:hypothetical protein
LKPCNKSLPASLLLFFHVVGPRAWPVEAVGIGEVFVLLISCVEQGDYIITAETTVGSTETAAAKQKLAHQAALFIQGCACSICSISKCKSKRRCQSISEVSSVIHHWSRTL